VNEISDFKTYKGVSILNTVIDPAKRHSEINPQRVNGAALNGLVIAVSMIIAGDARIKNSRDMQQMAKGLAADIKGKIEALRAIY